MDQRKSLRQQMRLRRQAQSKRQQGDARRQFFKQGTRLLASARSVGAFLGFDGEPDLKSLIRWCWRHHKLVALPVVARGKPIRMQLHWVGPQTKLRKNRYGIAEPVQTRRVRLVELDVLLMPLTAFDRRGHRLGMGAGYYDRLLKNLPSISRPVCVGVAFHWQEVSALTPAEWDQPMQRVLTEKSVLTCCRV